MSDQVRDPFRGGGGPPIVKFEEDGDSVEGTIVSVDHRAATDIDGNVKRFPDGRPMPLVIVTLDTPDGQVRDFVQGRSISQFRTEVWAVEGDDNPPQPGASYKRTLVGHGEVVTRGRKPEKLYEVHYSRGSGGDRELV